MQNRVPQILGFHGVAHSPYGFGKLALIIAMMVLIVPSIGATIAASTRYFKPFTLPYIDTKLAFLEANPTAYDTLVIGTSRIFRGFDTKEFDEHNRALGCETRTFNLGIPALDIREMDYLLTRLEARPFSGIKTVLLDPQVNPDARIENLSTQRGSRLVTIGSLPISFRNVLGDSLYEPQRRQRLLDITLAHLAQGVGVGSLSRYLQRLDEDRSLLLDYADNDGYFPSDFEGTPAHLEANKRFKSEKILVPWEAETEKQMTPPKRISRVPPARAKIYVEFYRRLVDSGYDTHLLFVAQPQLAPQVRHVLSTLPVDFPAPIYLDPVDYPDLYDSSLWFDPAHFNSTGARLATKQISNAFCR